MESEEARLALLERTIDRVEASATGPNSVRVSWWVDPAAPGRRYVDGFRLHHRRRRTDRYEAFETLEVAATGEAAVDGLDEFVEYEIFVQPVSGGRILGQPSNIVLVRTHQVRKQERKDDETTFSTARV